MMRLTNLFNVFVLMLLILPRSTFGQTSDYTPETFCKEFVNRDGSGKRPTFKESLNLFRNLFIQTYRPSKMVEVLQLNPSQAGTSSSRGEKVIFILLPNPTLSDEENNRIRETLDLWKEVKKLELVKKMQHQFKLEQELCISMTKEYPVDFKFIQKFHDVEAKNNSILLKKLDANSYAAIDESLKKYTKDGWEIVKTDNYTEIFSTLQNNKKISEIMFLLHSITDASTVKQKNTGLLYDASANILPPDFFFALPNSIQKVLILTCHSKEVIQFYRIEEAGKNFDFYYATPSKNFENLLQGSFPQSARYAFRKASQSETSIRPKMDKSCQLVIDSNKERHAAYIELLSGNPLKNRFVGVLNGKKSVIPLNCASLPNQNLKVTASYIGTPGMKKSSLEITAMKLISSSGKETPLKLTEQFKVMYPDEHYETVGRATKLN